MQSARELKEEYREALQEYRNLDATHKISIRFKAIGRAPILKQQVYKISSSQKFGAVTSFLRGQLNIGPDDDLHIYVNNSFSPAPDDILINLFKCFKTDEQLVLSYSPTAAFG